MVRLFLFGEEEPAPASLTTQNQKKTVSDKNLDGTSRAGIIAPDQISE
jgi:hypothetical protein